MTKNDIIRKLTSKKLWTTFAVIALAVANYLGADGNEIREIASMVTVLLSGGIYTICETSIDLARIKTNASEESESDLNEH